MLKHFFYKKDNGSVSERFAYPMGIVDNKLFAVDLSEYESVERAEYEALLEKIHTQYIQAIKEAGMGTNFRYFFFKGIQDVRDG